MSNFYVDLLRRARDESKTVLVVGAGISGLAAAMFFRRHGITVRITEMMARDEYFLKSRSAERAKMLEQEGVQFHFDISGESIFSSPLSNGVILCVVSPGVKLKGRLLAGIRAAGVPITNEVELGVSLWGVKPIAVTGSNGKSTTTALIAHLLNAAGFDAVPCGNLGEPVLSCLPNDVLEIGWHSDLRRIPVVEVSSYQLELAESLGPKVAVVLNLSENHLERHGTMDEYARCKANIFRGQGEGDLAVLNGEDAMVSRLVSPAACTGFFGQGGKFRSEVWSARIEFLPEKGVDQILVKTSDTTERYLTSTAMTIGRHNRDNIAAALLAARWMGVPYQVAHDGVLSFHPLAHRLEPVASHCTQVIINDSKSTTVASALAAWRAVRAQYPSADLNLMLGGQAKEGSWSPLFGVLEEDSKLSLYFFGQDGGMIAEAARSHGLKGEVLGALAAAVPRVLAVVPPHGVVLFSPGCASFDEFRGFDERGEKFKVMVSTFFGDRRK